MGCNCGCNTCETKTLTLNESVAPIELLSESLRYHIDNNRPLTEHLYRAGSKKYFELFSEARDLYSRNIINLSGDDLEIINETNLGHFGVLENNRKVPLDYPMLCEGERMKLKDITWEKVKELFPNSYQDPKDEKDDPSDEYYSYYDSVSFPNPDDSLTSVEHRNMLDYWKETTLKRYGDVDVEFNPNEVWFNKVKIIDDEFSKDKEQFSKGKQAFLDRERELGRTSGLDEVASKILDEVKKRYHINEAKKKKKKDPPIGKPMRSSSGGKAYKVYVRDPKTKNIKTVRFGSGGLKAKINNSKARAAFSKRHDCPNKKDRTKASYWSCRLPRYAKLLGLKSSFSGFW